MPMHGVSCENVSAASFPLLLELHTYRQNGRTNLLDIDDKGKP